MDRRDFLKTSGLAGLSASLFLNQRGIAYAADTKPLILVNFHAQGGWDPAFLFTPKAAPLSPYRESDFKQVGPFTIAPSSEAFTNFMQTYQSKILVINGIHSSTNDHYIATRYLGTGKLAEGHPHIGALWAAIGGPDKDLAFSAALGGFNITNNLVPFSPLLPLNTFETLLGRTVDKGQSDLITADLKARMDRYGSNARLSKREMLQLAAYRKFRGAQSKLEAIPVIMKDLEAKFPIPDEGEAQLGEAMRRYLFPALAYCATDLVMAVSFGAGFFDTHSQHNELHPQAITLAFTLMDTFLKGAAQLGFADRVVLVMTSDFGRSPEYADGGGSGKGHWPIGSALMIGPGIQGGRIVGDIDKNMQAVKVNPTTLKLDDNGVQIMPEHLHMALRQVLGIGEHTLAKQYPLEGGDKIKLLG